MSHSTRSGKDF